MVWLVLSAGILVVAVVATLLIRRFPAAGRWIAFFAALMTGTTLDLLTKVIAFQNLPREGEKYEIFSWFAFAHARNEGAAFGMFQGKHTFFMLVTAAALVAIPYFVHTVRNRVLPTAVVLGLILSGVIGNFWDRIVFGYVRDFIDVHTPPSGLLYDFFTGVFNTHIWPTFNVADSFITTGAVIIVLVLSRPSKSEEEPQTAPPPPEPAPAGAVKDREPLEEPPKEVPAGPLEKVVVIVNLRAVASEASSAAEKSSAEKPATSEEVA